MNIVCLDLEGVLIPEIWKAVAAETGVEALMRTTRDEPDYDKLMHYRLDILAKHDIRLPKIQEVIGTLSPLDGAKEFISWLTSQTRVIILSDTFAQFASPLMAQLGFPTLFCHELILDPEGRVTGYKLRQDDQKRKAVEALRSLNFGIIAAGDSYNDLSMLQSADHGILYCPADQFAAEYPDFPVARNHDALKAELVKLGI
ncbi:bifunctional phosphoserine phosphatase/homoserine phosphotransferase ThrH [Rubellicoccus peritrichatus]|uniref:phosphoserine phosphatase n=1 Tax=Rubellicoccus peritrichatus TaxID=3080537 RepID=A0AAQ3LEX4_9BACT|nr:bifunctional phosphoserine phosphatase/homoserine phosphotransferase ThrH [Puniceicoccus sp. CR14]WOO42403.1 bifunctional phosphoserine phosphatase/homoserine phosphotransferase ThrH [Puniceicoccus sp. CR14]